MRKRPNSVAPLAEMDRRPRIHVGLPRAWWWFGKTRVRRSAGHAHAATTVPRILPGITRGYLGWLLICCVSAVFLCGCASTAGSFPSPLVLGKGSIAKQAEKDPFPTASQVGLAQK